MLFLCLIKWCLKMSSTDSSITKKIYPVTGMSCAGCSSSVESMLKAQEGVVDAGVNLANQTAWVNFHESLVTPTKLQEAIRSIGYDLLIDESQSEKQAIEMRERNLHSLKVKTIFSASLTLPVVLLGMVFMDWYMSKWISMLLSSVIIFWFGRTFFVNAVKQTRHLMANMDTLVALSTSIAFLFSVFNTLYPQFWLERGLHPHVYYESASVIITFILLGKWLEERAKGKTSSSIRKLMGLQPDKVIVVRGDSLVEMPAMQLQVGDIILVKPGSRIPVDGKIVEGISYVDESSITGEPIPVLKKIEDKVFAGTSNQKGSFKLQAEQVGSETVLSKIIKMVEEAQGSKAPVQKLADKIAGIFVPSVLVIAVITFIIWLIFGGNDGFTMGLQAMVTVLAIACPCALGLATPTAIMVGIGKGAENHILIKDAESIEIANRTNTVILDKTGTITEGQPEVVDIYWDVQYDLEKFSSILFTLELYSEHPLAEAITRYFKKDELKPVGIDNFQSIPGLGVMAAFNGINFLAGSISLINNNNIDIAQPFLAKIEKWTGEGRTLVFFADDKTLLAVIAIADKIKSTSREAIHKLQTLGVETWMLTGDSEKTAQTVANETGISNYQANLLPADKARIIKELQQQQKVVAMVGDGINDSYALAQADISIAMGKGSDVAMDIAKITLITSDLSLISKTIMLSKQTMRIVKQNLFWAFIYNIIGIPIAAGILFPFFGFQFDPMIAGVAMALSSVSVVSNSLRLRNIKL